MLYFLPYDFNNYVEDIKVEGIMFELFALCDADHDDEDSQIRELGQNNILN